MGTPKTRILPAPGAIRVFGVPQTPASEKIRRVTIPHVKRRLLNLLIAVSLLLSIAIAVMWIRSYWYQDLIPVGRANHGILYDSDGGAVVVVILAVPLHQGNFCRYMDEQGRMDPLTYRRTGDWGSDDLIDIADLIYSTTVLGNGHPSVSQNKVWKNLGFIRESCAAEEFAMDSLNFIPTGRNKPQMTTTLIGFPYWFLSTIFSAIPAVRLFRIWKRSRRYPRGHCRKCGYDLRETPQRCPECGTVPAVPN
jgi:hypothetical protein